MSQETNNNKLYLLVIILSIAVVVIAAGFYIFVATTASERSYNLTVPAEQKSLSVSGAASALVIPDTASISLGVLIQAPTAREATEKNAASMNAVVSALKNLGIEDKDIRTSFLSIQPVFNYPRDGGAPTISGYSASNNVMVTTKMLGKLGDIVDKSVAAGSNNVGGISFVVSDENQKQVRDQLLADAVKDAEGKANKLAQSLNVKIVGVRTSSISEGGFPQPVPVAIAEKAGTPIQPGESEVTLSVQVVYIIE